MYLESPVTTTPEVVTDRTLEHLYTLRELLAGSHLWCSGRIHQSAFGEDRHCVLGLAVIAVGGDPTSMKNRTSQAYDFVRGNDQRMWSALSRAAHANDPIGVNDGPGYPAVVEMVDKAIAIRKAEL